MVLRGIVSVPLLLHSEASQIMKGRTRGFKLGNVDDVAFAINKSVESLRETYALNGDNLSARVLFFDDNMKLISVLPCLTSPIETNGRATMLAINSLTKNNQDIDYVLMLSAVVFVKSKGTVVHFESRENRNVTTDLLFEKVGACPSIMREDFYQKLVGGSPFEAMPFYGFFDEPEFIIRNNEIRALRSDFGLEMSESMDLAAKNFSKTYKKLKKYFLN